MSPTEEEFTGLLKSWSGGDQTAFDRLVPLVYRELKRLAHQCMAGERENHILQTTALVNEAYLRLVNRDQVDFLNRTHFFALCARLMRHVLIDYARSRRRLKRGKGDDPLLLDEKRLVSEEGGCDLVSLDEALTTLARIDSRKSEVVELRFFGGLNVEETAEVLKVSAATVKRDWSLARAWLHRELSGNLTRPSLRPTSGVG